MRDHGQTKDVLRVNLIACEGVGICVHLAPDLVRVDSWGFPIVAPLPLDRTGRRHARAAVRACPHKALFIEDSAS